MCVDTILQTHQRKLDMKPNYIRLPDILHLPPPPPPGSPLHISLSPIRRLPRVEDSSKGKILRPAFGLAMLSQRGRLFIQVHGASPSQCNTSRKVACMHRFSMYLLPVGEGTISTHIATTSAPPVADCNSPTPTIPIAADASQAKSTGGLLFNRCIEPLVERCASG